MRVRKMSGGRNNPVAKRLRHLRAVFSGDDNGARFAQRVGMSYTRWNNFENGFPLSLEAAHLLVKAVPGLTLDYLFYGHDAGLSVALQRRLTGQFDEVEPEAT